MSVADHTRKQLRRSLTAARAQQRHNDENVRALAEQRDAARDTAARLEEELSDAREVVEAAKHSAHRMGSTLNLMDLLARYEERWLS